MGAKEVAEIKHKAYDLGYRYEAEMRGCGQCATAAVYDALGWPYDPIFKSLSGAAGGMGMVGDGNCGAFLAGALILGNQVGRERDDFKDEGGKRFDAYRLTRALRERFVEHYGATICAEMHQEIFGRRFNLLDPEQMVAFDEAGGHSSKCPEVVAHAASWIIEILDEEGLLETGATGK